MTQRTSNCSVGPPAGFSSPDTYQTNLQELADTINNTVNRFITDVSSLGATKGIFAISHSFCTSLMGKNSRYSQAFHLVEKENKSEEISTAKSLDEQLQSLYAKLRPQGSDSQEHTWNDAVIFYLFRGVAKISAHFLEQFLFFLLQDWKMILEKDVKSFVSEKELNGFVALRKDVYSHLEQYILEVQRAHEEALLESPKDLQEVDDLVREKLAYLTREPQELYNAFSHWFLTKYPPALFFCKVIDYELSRIRFSTTSVFSYGNRILAIVTKVLSVLIQCFVVIPEKGVNRLIQYRMQGYISKKIKVQIDKHLNPTDKEKLQKNLLRNILTIVKKPKVSDLIEKTLPSEDTERLQKLIGQVFDLIDYQNEASLEVEEAQQAQRPSKMLKMNFIKKPTPLSEIGTVRTFLQSSLANKGGKILANQLQKEQLLRQCIEIIPKLYKEILNKDFSKKDEQTIDNYLIAILTVLINNFSVERTGYRIPWIQSIIERKIIPNSIIQGIAKPLLTLAIDPKHHVYGVIHPLMKAAVGEAR